MENINPPAADIDASTKAVDVVTVRKSDEAELLKRLVKWDKDYPVNGWNGYAGLKELDRIIADASAALSVEPAQDETAATRDVIAERKRQIESIGFDASHDDMATKGQLATAAGCYILHATHLGRDLEIFWPWEPSWWKPTNRRRDLVKAGALILAEIERLDRAAPTSEETR